MEIRRFPLRSRSRIIINHQPVCKRIRSFVRLTEDVPTRLVSSRPKCTFQAPPPKLVHSSTETACSSPLTSQSTIHPVITTLLSHRTSKRRCASEKTERRDAEIAHQVCTVLSYLSSQLEIERTYFCRKQNCQVFDARCWLVEEELETRFVTALHGQGEHSGASA